MKIIEWMQKRLNGNNERKKLSSISVTHYMIHEKEELSDWPKALLAIGTFGSNELKQLDSDHNRAKTCAGQDYVKEFALEEQFENLHNELSTYLQGPASELDENIHDPAGGESPKDELSGLKENGRKENEKCVSSYRRGLDHNRNSSVGKRSLSFLLKKVFVCKSGFQPSPPPPSPSFLKDPLSTESTMEKLLRAILQKRIYPQGSSPTVFVKKYLETKPMPELFDEDSDGGSENDETESSTAAAGSSGSKWVKTDAEYIVLEI